MKLGTSKKPINLTKRNVVKYLSDLKKLIPASCPNSQKFGLRVFEVVPGLGRTRLFRGDFEAVDINGEWITAGGWCFAFDRGINPVDFCNSLRRLADSIESWWEN